MRLGPDLLARVAPEKGALVERRGYESSTGGEYSHWGAVSRPRAGNIPIGGLRVVHRRGIFPLGGL
eukprot:6866217-Pyramimonas_sp.AAC.1